MLKLSFRHAPTWLYTGMLLLLLSAAFFFYDRLRTDEKILNEIQLTLQDDFEACLRYYSAERMPDQEPPPGCVACELEYDKSNRLIKWSATKYLPRARDINRLRDLQRGPITVLGNRTYYQLRRGEGDHTLVDLIPLSITYEINNEFLAPYYFLGRWQEKFREYSQYLTFSAGSSEGDIKIRDDSGKSAFAISNLIYEPMRIRTRYWVLIFFSMSLLALAVFARIYTFQHWTARYWINLIFLVIVLALRGLITVINIPENYVSVDLFQPDVLAFHDTFAPSLGDLTINIFTLAAVMFILYTHVFRMSLRWYRKLIRRPALAWSIAVLTIGLSFALVAAYIKVFEIITVNSQVDIEFSNIFGTSVYSFLILLDVGILLLSVVLVMLVMLRFNVLFGIRQNYSPLFLVVHILALIGFSCYFFMESWSLVPISVIAIMMFMVVVYRSPFDRLLTYDISNYLILIFVFSLLVTYSVVAGIELKNEVKAEQIASRILGSQVTNTMFDYEISTSSIQTNLDEVRERMLALNNHTAFRDWVQETYLEPNFRGFDVSLFMYDSDNNRLDEDRERQPAVPPDADIPLKDRSEQIRDSLNLFLIPNYDNTNLDLYVGMFSLTFDSADTRLFVLELSPTSWDTEGLYPSLSLDENLYEEIQLVNSFDHAIYRNGSLYRQHGQSSFPIYWEMDTVSYSRVVGNYREFVEPLEPLDNNRLVVIRYEMQGTFNIITAFSFIFYFYALATLVLIAVPVFVFRLMRRKNQKFNLPLRAKIRLGLLAISILPMFVIILILSPFIRQRYYDQANEELKAEASRIANVLGPDYLVMQRNALTKIAMETEFREVIRNLQMIAQNDVNIFDKDGRRINSTQPLIFEAGLRSDLMHAGAYESLKTGEASDFVAEEKIGTLPYFSAYKPIIGDGKFPAGYIHIPSLAHQDELEQEIQGFLAYLANIYLLVFLLLNVVAVLLSNTITRPLLMVQQRLSATGLGNENEQIDYVSQDEIGAIVNAYNEMVGKLAESKQELSQTQRELAWRQMARQVAHEIKNPLTPMKLSIQHLTRAWNENTPKLQQMFPRVMQTLLVQIESMVRIANSFSEFARMPETVKARVSVNAVLLEVVDLYAQHENAMWLIDVPQDDFFAYIDRDQLSRTFNNIIKNALQAISENGLIHVSMKLEGKKAKIEIRDNGKGMSPEVQAKIFEPSFSTKTSGMGLGLAIVKRAIESSGGKIYFESEEDKGTVFFIELPKAEVEQELVHVNM